MARKGDLKATKHLNVSLDDPLATALQASAMRNERRLTEEARFAIRQYLGVDLVPAEDRAGGSA